MAWTTTNSRDLYGIERWGNRFFDINELASLRAAIRLQRTYVAETVAPPAATRSRRPNRV